MLRIPVAREGWPFILPPAALACTLVLMGWWAAAVALAAIALAFLGFFRDPERTVPDVPNAIIAPADGKVLGIAPVDDAWVGDALRLSIFLSPLDVHVNRAPIAALVRDVEYAPGTFAAAYRDVASETNERSTLLLEGEATRVTVRQIAGVLARRIVCRARPGDKLQRGERFGMIRFGSRTDLVVPRSTEMRVQIGDRVRGGESIVGLVR